MFRLALALFLLGTVTALEKGKSNKDRSRNEPHCGLPPFTDNLPATEKTKVQTIWEHYEIGDDCETQRSQTKKILESLPHHVRQRVLVHRGPAFLNGASPDVKKQFEDLWKDKDIPRAEKPEKFKELAQRLLNPIQMKEFNKFSEKMTQRREAFKQKLAALSPEARAAHEKLTELKEQRQKLYTNLSEAAKTELSALYHEERFDRHDRK